MICNKEVYEGGWIDITSQVTIDYTKISNAHGQFYVYKKDGLCCLHLGQFKFLSNGNNQLNCITGLPKAIVQTGAICTGSSSDTQPTVAQDVGWIAQTGTAINFHVKAASENHWVTLLYPCE